MAYQHGTATSTVDLWNKFVSFITTNADLVTARDNWEVVWTAPSGVGADGIVLKGPGASGLDSIYVGLNRVDDPAEDRQAIWIRGMTGILPLAPGINSHINVSPRAKAFFDANPMEYWFVANGRRFVILAKMSTVYSAIYGGFFLPYANPLAYPYPMFIGASAPDWTGTSFVDRWRSQSDLHRHFVFPLYNNENGAGSQTRSSAYMIDPNGSWLNVGDSQSSNVNPLPFYMNPNDDKGLNDWRVSYNYDGSSWDRLGYNVQRARLEENIGGGYSLSPISLVQTNPSIQNFGVLDGCFCAPGQNNAVENTVTIGGVVHLIVQNVFRTAVTHYWALRLE